MVKIACVLLTIFLGLTVFATTPTPSPEQHTAEIKRPVAWIQAPDPELEQFLYYDERKNQSKNKSKNN